MVAITGEVISLHESTQMDIIKSRCELFGTGSRVVLSCISRVGGWNQMFAALTLRGVVVALPFFPLYFSHRLIIPPTRFLTLLYCFPRKPQHEQRKEQEPKRPHIKKPLNAFMLYMKEMRANVVAECTLKESAAINQILGRRVRISDSPPRPGVHRRTSVELNLRRTRTCRRLQTSGSFRQVAGLTDSFWNWKKTKR